MNRRNAFPQAESRRATVPEIVHYLSEHTDHTIVCGFSEIIDKGDTTEGGERIAGYRETGNSREWYVPLPAKKGLSWKTEPIPKVIRSKVAFVMSVGFGNSSPPQPSGQWNIYVNNRLAVSVRVVKHSQVWKGKECILEIRAAL